MFCDPNQKSIRLNTDISPCYGRVRDREGCCYSVVTIHLFDTYSLEDRADDPRFKGLTPLFYWTPDGRDINRLFDFYAEINDKHEDHIEVRVWCVDMDGEVDDFIFSDEEKAKLLKKLSSHCRRIFGKNCGELLKDAREHMDPEELRNIKLEGL